MARAATPAILTVESNLTHYFEQIRRFPLLERQDEYLFAKHWREHGDRDAAHRLVTSHLRLVAKLAGPEIGSTDPTWRSMITVPSMAELTEIATSLSQFASVNCRLSKASRQEA